MNRDQLLTLALELPPEERAALADELIESLSPPPDDEIDAAWREEVRRRLERLDSGQATTIPWAEARRRIWLAAGRDPDT
jgi:putative addiction module component (TIGR02574 family)